MRQLLIRDTPDDLKTWIDEESYSRRIAKKEFVLSLLHGVARTLADLEDSETIRDNHIGEAIQYRNLDRQVL